LGGRALGAIKENGSGNYQNSEGRAKKVSRDRVQKVIVPRGGGETFTFTEGRRGRGRRLGKPICEEKSTSFYFQNLKKEEGAVYEGKLNHDLQR